MFNLLSNLKNWHVLGILIAVAVLSAVFSASARGGTLDAAWWADLWQGLTTEMFGAGATFLLIEVFLERRRRREEKEAAIEEQKAALIRQMRSSVKEEATRAVEELQAHDWLIDGSLQGAKLRSANLQRVNLRDANLQETDLSLANLQGANLVGINLQGANLVGINLQGADLRGANLQRALLAGANLQGAQLLGTNLQGAHLGYAKLQGAVLLMADLQGAQLEDAKFNETTILPDDNKWSAETDLRRFTDPTHQQFWRSDIPYSPAYPGKGEA